jgi:hypothetical protein
LTGIVNGSILVIMILIPLIYPEALPQGDAMLTQLTAAAASSATTSAATSA